MTTTLTATEQMTEAEAKVITHQIIDGLENLCPLVIEAWQRRAWAALDYADWDAYVAAEFGDLLQNIPRIGRVETVKALTEAGMSIRAITPVVGMSKSQIARDVQVSHDGTPGATTVTGVDGKKYPRRPPAESSVEVLKPILSWATVATQVDAIKAACPNWHTGPDFADVDDYFAIRQACMAVQDAVGGSRRSKAAKEAAAAISDALVGTFGSEFGWLVDAYLTIADQLDEIEPRPECEYNITSSGRDTVVAWLDALSSRISQMRADLVALPADRFEVAE